MSTSLHYPTTTPLYFMNPCSFKLKKEHPLKVDFTFSEDHSHLNLHRFDTTTTIKTIPISTILSITSASSSFPNVSTHKGRHSFQRLADLIKQQTQTQPSSSSSSSSSPNNGDEGCWFAIHFFLIPIPRPFVDHRTSFPLHTLLFKTDSELHQQQWMTYLHTYCFEKNRYPTPFSFLVVVNPMSGKKKGKQLLECYVLPLLTIAGVPFQLEETKGPNHAFTLAQELSFTSFTGALLMGGDGLIHEFLNGLCTRSDFHTCSSLNKPMPFALGQVAAGSGNGLATNLNCLSPCVSILSLLHPQLQCLELMCVRDLFTQALIKYCFLSVTVGYIADVDIESEKYRALGALRFQVYGLIRFLRQRTYFLKVTSTSSSSSLPSSPTSITPSTPLPPSPTSFNSQSNETHTTSFAPFFFFNLVKFSYLSTTFQLCPQVPFNDGYLHLIYSHTFPYFQGLPALLNSSSGVMMQVPGVHYLKVKQVTLERKKITNKNPTHSKNTNQQEAQEPEGCFVLDGEPIPHTSISIDIVEPFKVWIYTPFDFKERLIQKEENKQKEKKEKKKKQKQKQQKAKNKNK